MSTQLKQSAASFTLDAAPARCRAVICAVDATPDDAERLAGLGLCPGRSIELIKHGDPLILRVYGVRIGLCARLARRIHLELSNDEPSAELPPPLLNV